MPINMGALDCCISRVCWRMLLELVLLDCKPANCAGESQIRPVGQGAVNKKGGGKKLTKVLAVKCS